MLKFHWFYYYLLRGQGGQREFGKRTTFREVPSGRGKGEGKPSPLWACLRSWRFGGFGDLFKGSTRFEAEASADSMQSM